MRIALLDSGVRRSHCVFDGADIEDGKNYIERSASSGLPDAPYGTKDYLGHGTFIASLLLAQPGNPLALSGLVPEAVLVPLRCFDGETASCELLTEAIYDAVDVYGCDVILMSWGVPYEDEALHEAIRYASDAGLLLIASAGNDGEEGAYYPAVWPEVVSVGALGPDGKPASFSETGEAVDVYASGVDLRGAGHTSDRAESVRSGTSFAAAFAAALAVRLKQENPDAAQAELFELIKR